MSYSSIFFDLDGTLTDPKVGITSSVRFALSRFGIHEPDPEALVPYIGPPLQRSFQEFHGLSELESRQAVDRYREYFADRGIFENEVYPGIPELLGRLRVAGRPMMVVTSKPTVFARRILHHFGLEDFFAEVVGSNLDGSLSDKGELIALALSRGRLDPAATVMIGDRKHDILGAACAGVESIAVAYGHGSLEELEHANPTHLVKTVADLATLLLPTPA
jgi:phosphoglycolate phosphatase